MDIETLLDIPPWDWPENAGTMFRSVLTNHGAEPADRLAAAKMAGDITVINDKLATILVTIVGNSREPEELRARAAIALGPVLEQTDTDGFDDLEEAHITERTFDVIRASLHKIYLDEGVPKEVRRRALEASVRSPQDWHKDAIEAAYSSGDREWKLTAVFAMHFVRGFEERILESLESTDEEIHYEAVQAAGNWELDGAWDHVAALVKNPSTPKPLLLAAIGAAGTIRPKEALEILDPLAHSEDEDVAETADEAIVMARGLALYEEDWDEDEEDDIPIS